MLTAYSTYNLHDDTYAALEILAIALEHNPEDRYKLTLEYPDIKRLLLHLEKPGALR